MSSLHNIVQFEKYLFGMSDMSFKHISRFFILHTTYQFVNTIGHLNFYILDTLPVAYMPDE